MRAPERAFQGGWYRTGDVAELRPDGEYRLFGRTGDAIPAKGRSLFAPVLEEHHDLRHPVAEVVVFPVPGAAPGTEPGLLVGARRPGPRRRPGRLRAVLRAGVEAELVAEGATAGSTSWTRSRALRWPRPTGR